jgi:hypothetical protein
LLLWFDVVDHRCCCCCCWVVVVVVLMSGHAVVHQLEDQGILRLDYRSSGSTALPAMATVSCSGGNNQRLQQSATA